MRTREWFRDRALRKVAKFGVPVAIGKLFTSISGLIILALLARHLGPGPFGVLAVIRTVVTVVDQYANFNTWQAIIKFGAEAIAERRPRDVERVIKLAFVIDILTAALGTAVVVGLAYIVPATFDWSPAESKLCVIYSITLLTRTAGASDGVFRICDAYRAQAIVTSLAAVVMTAFVAIAVYAGASFEYCVIALIAGEVVNNVAVTLASCWIAKECGYGGWYRASLRGIRQVFPGIVRFMLATNAQLTVKKTNTELDMIVVGALLGKVPAGLFRVVKQLGTIPGRVFMPFEQVLFTELARASAERDYPTFERLLWRSVAILGIGSTMLWLVASVGARPLVELVAGHEFAAAAESFRWYLLAMVITVMAVPVQRGLVALGRPGSLFMVELASLGLLVVIVIAGALVWGLVGVALAVLLHKIVQLLAACLLTLHFTRTHASRAA